jgi:hypothetical protein
MFAVPSFFGFQRAGFGTPLLLDLYPSAAAAYSVRKLRTAYTGNAIRVRRSSDNAEQNIGFDGSGNLNTTALTTFCSGTNGFVTTWYDQSGNANNATQTVAVNQPQIVSSGAVLTKNGKPSLFSQTLNFFTITLISYNDFSHFAVAFNDGTSGQRRLTGSNSGINGPVFRYISNNAIQTTDNVKILATSPNNSVPSNALNIIAGISNNTNSIVCVNNTSTTTTTIRSSTSLQVLFATGFPSIVEPLNSYCSEFITYTSNQASNLTGINSNLNSYYVVY